MWCLDDTEPKNTLSIQRFFHLRIPTNYQYFIGVTNVMLSQVGSLTISFINYVLIPCNFIPMTLIREQLPLKTQKGKRASSWSHDNQFSQTLFLDKVNAKPCLSPS